MISVVLVFSILLGALLYKWGKHVGGQNKALEIHNKYYDYLPEDFEAYIRYEAFERPMFYSSSPQIESRIKEKIVLPKNVIKLTKRSSSPPKTNGPYKK